MLERIWVRRGWLACGALAAALAGAAAVVAVLAAPPRPAAATYRSPYDVAFSPDGKLLAVSDHTAGRLVVLDADAGKVLREVALKGRPAGVAWSGRDNRVLVAELGAGTVAEVDAAAGKVIRRLNVGPRPVGLAVAPKANLLLVTDEGLECVDVLDLGDGKRKGRVPVIRQPQAVAVTPDESLAVAANFLAAGDATDANTSAAISLIDLKSLRRAADIRLPAGSTMVHDVTVSADGKWAYAMHTLGRFTLPTTQLDRGWINTNALSILDLGQKKLYATVLLDRLTEGAADPWAVAVSRDGKTLWATLSGVHQLAQVDLERLGLLAEGKPLPPDPPDRPDPSPRHLVPLWGEIGKDPARRADLANDLAALYAAGLLVRRNLDCSGPRGMDLSPDGKRLAVAAYFTGSVLLVDAETCKVTSLAPVGVQPQADNIRRGEMIFHDGTYSFQHWLSCATCHPTARADGLNWDLLNDGIGNPKNSRSLVWAHKTPPMMSLGVRADVGVASLAGFRFILFREPEKDEVEAVKAYLASLEPDTSPRRLPNGDLSPKARQGKAIFEDPKNGCVSCHPPGLYTDLKMYDVGTRGKFDRSDEFDTPTLVELWRTPPYLHDGAARDLHEVFTTFNKKDQHGKTSHLTREQLDALVEYLLSL